MQDTKTIFPDTNIILHYPPIDQIDWLRWCKSKSVKVVLCLKVIDELDKKKCDPLFKERANNAIKKIRKIEQEGGHIKKDIVLEIYNEDRLKSEDSADEKIVLQALDYMTEHPDEDICIMTEDYGMQLRCRQRVDTIEPDNYEKARIS